MHLTPREWEILEAFASGRFNKQADVSSALHMSHHTLKTHLAHIYGKLDIHSQTQLVVWYHDHKETR